MTKRRYLDEVKAENGLILVPFKHPDNLVEYLDQRRVPFSNIPSNNTNKKTQYVIEDVITNLGKIENSPHNKTGGWNNKQKRWYPHTSIEGGENTIAYGLKLINHKNPAAKRWTEIVKKQGYLTDPQAIQARREITESYRNDAKTIYDNLYGKGAFDNLDVGLQAAATDIQYNGGLGNFNNFMEAAYTGNREKARKETHRTSNGKSLGRNKIIQDYIDATIPYIGKNFRLKYGGLINIRPSLKSGGSIYIKPSHRGRLTELKARTGKSEAELYNDGNPAHKKMVVFARNARKWKH